MNRTIIAKTVAYGIASIAAISSYGHQVHLLSLADLDPLFGFIPSEWVTPITVDLLAIIALMVRTDERSTDRFKKYALLPLILAGGLSVAANVALARNIVQVIVGVWTVLAYIVAELFVAKMERKPDPEPEVTPARPVVSIGEAERAARKRAGYDQMDKVAKAAWTKAYRDRVAKRTAAAVPTSPGMPPVGELQYAD